MSTEPGDPSGYTWKLLHPELLPREELLHILREKQVHIDGITSQDKWKLVEIFKRVAMPQSQRTCFQDKTTKMEIDNKSPSKTNSSSRESQLKPMLTTMQTSTAAHKPNLICAGKVTSQPTKIKLKRPACQITESPSVDSPSPIKKRERITWP